MGLVYLFVVRNKELFGWHLPCRYVRAALFAFLGFAKIYSVKISSQGVLVSV